MTQTATKTEPPTVRDLLAKAQADKAAAHAALQKAQQADTHSLTAVSKAKQAVIDAQQAEATARTQHVAGLAASGDGSTATADSYNDARSNRQKAEEHFQLTQEARTICREALERAKENVSQAEYRCVDLAATVIADEVPDLIAEVRDLQAKLVRRRLELRWLVQRRLIPYDYNGRRLLQDAIDTLNDRHLPHHDIHDADNTPHWAKVNGADRWSRWRDELENDASAQLAPLDDSHN